MVMQDTTRPLVSTEEAALHSIPRDLESLNGLEDWEIANGEPDPRGWDMVAINGDPIGQVVDLLVSRSTLKAHFAIVKANDLFGSRTLLIPLRDAVLDAKAKNLVARAERTQIAEAPAYEGGRDYQRFYDYWYAAETAGTRAATVTEPALPFDVPPSHSFSPVYQRSTALVDTGPVAAAAAAPVETTGARPTDWDATAPVQPVSAAPLEEPEAGTAAVAAEGSSENAALGETEAPAAAMMEPVAATPLPATEDRSRRDSEPGTITEPIQRRARDER